MNHYEGCNWFFNGLFIITGAASITCIIKCHHHVHMHALCNHITCCRSCEYVFMGTFHDSHIERHYH